MTDDSRPDRTNRTDHTHPHTDQPFGLNGVYGRGPDEQDDPPTIEAEDDDGESDGDASRPDAETDGGRDADRRTRPRRGVQRVFDRGGEVGVGRGR